MTGRVHIVGAGLAGLAAAVALLAKSQNGRNVSLYESTSQAGGRCRSFHDDRLGRVIDNGNHLMLSGNRALAKYLSRIGAVGRLDGPASARFDFYDYASRESWVLDLGSGVIPWSLMKGANRVPASGLSEYLAGLRTVWAGPKTSVEACLNRQTGGISSKMYERLWHPLATAILNTDPAEARAASLWPVFRQAFARGAKSCRPLIARESLSDALITPAIEYLQHRGATLHFQHRLVSVDCNGGRVQALSFKSHRVRVEPDDAVIFAVPPGMVSDMIGGMTSATLSDGAGPGTDEAEPGKMPSEYRPIINGHLVLPRKLDKLTIIGLTNALSQWIFVRGDLASVTISAAGPYMDLTSQHIAGRLWSEIVAVLGLGDVPLGAYRIIREKRATIAQTPSQEALRPPCLVPGAANLFLAGDWTATGLPATIEGAIQSGHVAAQAVVEMR